MSKRLLPKSEFRRQYMGNMVHEAMLLFGLSKDEAEEFAARYVVYTRAKLEHEDEICFGTGKIYPRQSKPRDFNLISGEGPGKRQRVSMGIRITWAVKFFKGRKARSNNKG